MAVPMTADQLVKALRDEGVRLVEHRAWRTHNRNHKGAWGPVHGVYIHHTAGVSKNMPDICYDGYDALPGPVCHGMLAKSAKVYLVGHGRANHAGGIAQNAYDAAVNEDPVHPRPDATEPIDGNTHFYGLEIENEGDGTDPFPADQYDQAVRWAAAHCRFHGWTANSVIGHKEATRRKTDPAFPMTTFRTDVDERLAHPASWSPGENEEDNDMPISDDDLKRMAFAVQSYKGTGKTNDIYWYQLDTNTLARQARDEARSLNARLERLERQPLTDAQIAAIAAAVAKHPALADAIADKLAARLTN
ncbi:peptidoglycan recognition protein family protein [Streptomyces omiyaensis]|uniref:peptidoglycan recognition protein family protein n=1 Tax=Streptomyces omiyaensis TaxID=68247 RepID=UPI0036FD96FF